MTPDRFRRLALEQPASEERAHHDHPDFRVDGKIFATLGPVDSGDERGRWAMLRLPADNQAALVDLDPEAYEPMPGAWGKQGCTRVWLARAKVKDLAPYFRNAWRHRATARTRKAYE